MPALMIQGCGSDVGKSVLVAGLCRLLTNRGQRVRPFKPQNMSNNAAVTADGGEIGRSTALQALACRIAPTSDMNPVLLKPQSDTGAQLIVQGRRVGVLNAKDHGRDKRHLLRLAVESYRRLASECDELAPLVLNFDQSGRVGRVVVDPATLAQANSPGAERCRSGVFELREKLIAAGPGDVHP